MEYKGSIVWALPTATRWGTWCLDNYITHVMWMYAFYAFLPVVSFLLWYKWTNGVDSSPFQKDDDEGSDKHENKPAGLRAFWPSQQQQ
jgi:hypothetical protein